MQFGQSEMLRSISSCPGAIKRMLNEVKFNKCFIIPKRIASNRLYILEKILPDASDCFIL